MVHYSISPLGDWYYHTGCGTYASDEWVTRKPGEVTCTACVDAIINEMRENSILD